MGKKPVIALIAVCGALAVGAWFWYAADLSAMRRSKLVGDTILALMFAGAAWHAFKAWRRKEGGVTVLDDADEAFRPSFNPISTTDPRSLDYMGRVTYNHNMKI